MRIIVCVKQVPDTTEIKIDPVTNTLIRAGVPSIVNTYDAYALELAARLKEEVGGTITVLSMGPEQAKIALKECLSVGADQAFLLSDRVFGGSDTLATSYVLARGIKYLEEKYGAYDLILCGKQAIDGDTAQVGPEIAEHLDLPQITYASTLDVKNGEIMVKRESDKGYDIVASKLPALVTVVKTAFEPRYPSIKSKMAANRAEILTINAEEINIDATKCGLKGSPTKVKKTFTPVHSKQGVKIKEESGQVAAKKLVELLAEAKLV